MLEGQERTWAQDKARRCHVFQCVGDWPLADVEARSQCLHSRLISACQPLDKYLSAS